MWAANKTEATMHCSSHQKARHQWSTLQLAHSSVVISVPTKRGKEVSVLVERIREKSASDANCSRQSRKISLRECH